MNKKILSALLIFAMIFSFVPLVKADFDSYADSGQEIRVRIEGKTDTLFDEVITVTNEETGEDLLRTAIGDAQIDGEVGQYGLFINGLLGEMAGESGDGYSTSWGLYIAREGELESPAVGISSLTLLDGLEELLLHVKASDPITWSDLTFIPRLEKLQQGEETKLIAKKVVISYDENWNVIESQEVVDGASLEIDGSTYVTDENGEISLQLEEGTYDVIVSKEGENYPELIRNSFEIIVDHSKFEEDGDSYTLWDIDDSNVASNKAWNIKFNKEILEGSLEDNIIVIDSDNNIVTGEIELLEDNIVKVNSPQGGYNVGGNYTLYIKNEIESIDGKVLNKSWKVEFAIVE